VTCICSFAIPKNKCPLLPSGNRQIQLCLASGLIPKRHRKRGREGERENRNDDVLLKRR
jgi:hypothetical protein